MMRLLTLSMLAGTAIALTSCNKPAAPEPANEVANMAEPAAAPKDPIESALSAAPAGLASAAAVVSASADGTMKSLREGTNGFTCMPDNPVTPGPDPMCMDANAMKWAQAWIGKKAPPADTVGLIYMLAGGTDASNTDPYATDPSKGKWVETGPHVMIVGAPSLTAQYKGGESPDTAAPYTMWEGTPYAHVMVPVK